MSNEMQKALEAARELILLGEFPCNTKPVLAQIDAALASTQWSQGAEPANVKHRLRGFIEHRRNPSWENARQDAKEALALIEHLEARSNVWTQEEVNEGKKYAEEMHAFFHPPAPEDVERVAKALAAAGNDDVDAPADNTDYRALARAAIEAMRPSPLSEGEKP